MQHITGLDTANDGLTTNLDPMGESGEATSPPDPAATDSAGTVVLGQDADGASDDNLYVGLDPTQLFVLHTAASAGASPSAAATLTDAATTVASTPTPNSSGLVSNPFVASDSDSGSVTAQLTNLQSAADTALQTIESALQLAIDAGQLPLVGPGIKSSFDASSALHAVESLQQALDAGIAATINLLQSNPADDLVATLTQQLDSALGANGFSQNVTVADDNGILTTALSDSKTVSGTVSLDGNLGFPGLSLQTAGSAQASLAYDFNLTLADDSADPTNPYVVAGGGPALTVAATMSAPNFTADAQLGFLEFKATDQGSSLNGNFGFGLNDADNDGKISLAELAGGNAVNTSLSGNANADVHLVTDLQNAALPSASADIIGNWSLGSNTSPSLSLDNVTYDLGSFVNNFVETILNDIRPVLQPLQDVIAVLNTDLTFLDAIPGAKALLDKAGGNDGFGNDAPDGKITLLDFIKLAAPTFNLVPAEGFITDAQAILKWAADLAGVTLGPSSYDLGSFSLPNINGNFSLPTVEPGDTQDLQTALANLTSSAGGGAGQDLQSLFSNSAFQFPILTNPLQAAQLLLGGNADLFNATLPQLALSFGPGFNSGGNPSGPLLTLASVPLLGIPGLDISLQGDFSAAMNLAFGYDTRGLQQFAASNFTDPSKIIDGLFVSDDINGTVQPLVSLEGLVRLGLEASVPVASASVGGDIEGDVDFTLNNNLGTGNDKLYVDQIAQALATNPFELFDTSGKFTAFFDAYVKVLGYTLAQYNSPMFTLGGFDFSPAATGSGNGSAPAGPPPLGISAATINLTSNIGDTLTIVGGTPTDPNATLSYQWQDSSGGGAFQNIAGATGSTYVVTRNDIGTQIQVVVTASETGQQTISTDSNADTPNFATLNGSELDVDIPDGNQSYMLAGAAGNPGRVVIQAFGQTQNFDGAQTVVVNAGNGNDTVTVAFTLTATVTVNPGGSGTGTVETFTAGMGDTLIGGGGVNYLYGNGGNDTLIGGSGTNIFTAGPGDQIVGGSGHNTLSFSQATQSVSIDLSQGIGVAHIGDGTAAFANIQEFDGSNFGDTFVGGADGIVFHGGTGNDAITGGSANDVLEGGGGADMIAGGAGADIFVIDHAALTSAQATTPVTISDYDQGSGGFNPTEGDQIDLSQLVAGPFDAGIAVPRLVRLIEDASGTFAKVQVNTAGGTGTANWTTVGRLSGVPAGASVNVILDPSQPQGTSLQVFAESFLLSTIAFAGANEDNQLWTIGGKPGPQHLFDNISPNGSSSPGNFITIGQQIFFTANDGTDGANELWVSDGTVAGTQLVTAFNSASGAIDFDTFFEFNGKLIFQGNDGTDGNQVWVSDGTAAGTQMLSNVPGGTNTESGESGFQFTQINGQLFFTDGTRLFESDGTAAGTHTIIDFSDPAWGANEFSDGLFLPLPAEANGKLIFGSFTTALYNEFYAVDPAAVDAPPSDVQFLTVNGELQGDVQGTPITLNGRAIFNTGGTLWSSDGTFGGTHDILGPPPDFNESNSAYAFNVGELVADAALGTALFALEVFAIPGGNTGEELWETDGTFSGTHVVKTINPNPTAEQQLHALTVTDDGTLYFAANDGVNGDALWKSDGTAAGTVMVKAINPNFQSTIFDESSFNLQGIGASGTFFAVHNRVYFTADDGTNGRQLWTSDGTAAGTYSLGVLPTGLAAANNEVTSDGDDLFFTADGPQGTQLWKTDGTIAGTVQVTGGGDVATDTDEFALFVGPPITGGEGVRTVPPPTGLELSSGVVGSHVTDQSQPEIAGTGEAGDTVKLFDGTTQLGVSTVRSDGSWSIFVAQPLSLGDHSLTATEGDLQGNISAPSTPLSLTITLPPLSNTDPLMTNTSGELVFDQVVNNQIAFTTIGGLGPEWEFDGTGVSLLGDGLPGFLIRNVGSVDPGAVDVGEVANGTASYTAVGGLGPEWQFEGNGDFLGDGQSQALIRNTGDVIGGALFLSEFDNGAANFNLIGGLGLEWEFDGTGDFLNDGRQDFLFRNVGAVDPGVLDVGEVVNGAAVYTQIGGVGTEWNFEGTGDFLGNGHADFLLWNNGTTEPGAMAIGEMVNGQLTFTDIGGVGPEWQFVGTGNYIDNNKTDFMIRNMNSGALVVGSVSGSTGSGAVNFTTVGAVGPEWTFHNTNPALMS